MVVLCGDGNVVKTNVGTHHEGWRSLGVEVDVECWDFRCCEGGFWEIGA